MRGWRFFFDNRFADVDITRFEQSDGKNMYIIFSVMLELYCKQL